jgi:hypothetical protein
MLDATPALIPRDPCSSYCTGFNRSPLRNLGTEADVEVGLTDPHPMQNARELTRDRSDRAQHARPFGDPQAPRPQCRPFPDPQQEACSGLAERLPNGYVALLADLSFIVDGRSRLVSSRRQAKMRSNRSRPRKAPGSSTPIAQTRVARLVNESHIIWIRGIGRHNSFNFDALLTGGQSGAGRCPASYRITLVLTGTGRSAVRYSLYETLRQNRHLSRASADILAV